MTTAPNPEPEPPRPDAAPDPGPIEPSGGDGMPSIDTDPDPGDGDRTAENPDSHAGGLSNRDEAQADVDQEMAGGDPPETNY